MAARSGYRKSVWAAAIKRFAFLVGVDLRSSAANGCFFSRLLILEPGKAAPDTAMMSRMGSTTFVPVEEYLTSSYDPDVDFVDGEIEERNVGEKDHAKLQLKMVRLLDRRGWFVTIETRLTISTTRYRVPDVCVYEQEPEEQVFQSAPWIVVEILSPEDRMSRMQRKLEDYHGIGCPNIWILDPWRRKAFRFDGKSIIEVSELESHDFRVSRSVAQIF